MFIKWGSELAMYFSVSRNPNAKSLWALAYKSFRKYQKSKYLTQVSRTAADVCCCFASFCLVSLCAWVL